MQNRIALGSYKEILEYVEKINPKVIIMLSGLLILIIMVFQLVLLAESPPVFVDEPWNANAAWTWLKTGVNFDSIHAGTLDQFGYEWIRRPFLGDAPWLISFSLLGLGLFQARLVSWFFGGLLLISTFLAGRRCYSSTTGVLAALFVSLSAPFIMGSHYARQDIILSFLGMVAFGMAIYAIQESKLWAHLIAGLLLGLSLDVHQNGLLFIPGLVALYIVSFRTQVLHNKGTWFAALGGFLGITFYLAIHVMPSPGTYFALYKFNFGGAHMMPLKTLSLIEILKSVRDEIGRYHFYNNNLDFALIGASMAYLAARHLKADRQLLSFCAAVFVSFVLLAGNKADYYAILLYPFLLLMVAEALVSLVKVTNKRRQLIFLLTLSLLFVGNSVIRMARTVNSGRGHDYYSISSRIKSVIPSDARVMGSTLWWLGMSDFDYSSILNLTYFHFFNKYSVLEGLRETNPNIIIVDDAVRERFWDKNMILVSRFDMNKLSQQEFDAFLDQNGEMILEIWNPWYGLIQVYRISEDMG